jgi:uncharacterized membrane protein
MKLRLIHLSFVIALVVSLVMPATSYAESTNREEVRAGLSGGGWSVVYGDLINEADYALFIAAVASSVACECPAPIYEYFDHQLQAQIDKIERTAPDIALEALEDLFVQAFNSDGEVLRHGRLEISGGLATYNRWETIIYHEPRTYKCKQDLPFGGWTWIMCTTTEEVERTTPYPNNFQPYFRFRWVSTSIDSEESSSGLSFRNSTSLPVWMALGYKDSSLDEWVAKGWWKIESGQTRTLITGDLKARYYYFYARDTNGAEWTGDSNFWYHPTQAFGPIPDSFDEVEAAGMGYVWQGFQQVDTGEYTSFTYTLNP